MNAHDTESLARSFITPELAEQARLYRVTSEEGAQLVGRNGHGQYAGLVFPYIWPGETSVRENRLRRDHPDLEQQPDGTTKEKAKYLSPPGRGSMLYFVPQTSPELLTEASLPVVITEGEKKTLALHRLAFQAMDSPPLFLPIGLAGVWNWRGTVGKTYDEKGARRDVKGVIPDFDRIIWQGRTVHIIFDANVATNESVCAARRGLAKELTRRGAEVRFVNLPDLPGVNGVDELLELKGADFVLSLIENAPRAEDVEKPPRKSQATVLVELGKDIELFHTPDGEPCASVEIGAHRETWPLNKRGFRDWLMRRFYEAEGATPSAQALQDALGVLSGQARFGSAEHELHTRVALHGDAIYLDLCDTDWRAVRIMPDGWEVVPHGDVKFRRTKGMLALPEPVRGGSVETLRAFVNVSDEDWPLIVTWLVATYRPGKPFPVLALHGEQGSAKSTTARVLRAFVDPNKAALRSEPRNEQDLMIAATNGWLVALDNLSRVPAWLSDALCRLATGGGFATRELYANDEETLFDAMRPVLLNGIEELATRSDLLDRALVLNLPTIPTHKRRTEADVWCEFEAARPTIFGALMDAVCGALLAQGSVRLPCLPRMADFALFATAAEKPLGLQPGAFMAAYTGNREAANDLALEASPIGAAIIAFIESEGRWSGTSTELLKALNESADEATQRQQGWAKSAKALGGVLKRLAPNLRERGMEYTVEREPNKKRTRIITLEQKSNYASDLSDTSESTDSLENSSFASDAKESADKSADVSDKLADANAFEELRENASNNGISDKPDVSDAKEQSLSDEALERAAIMEVDGGLAPEETEVAFAECADYFANTSRAEAEQATRQSVEELGF